MRLPRTGAFIDTLRLASGLTLFTFALLHFLNMALALWGFEAVAAMQGWRLFVTRSWAGALVLALALAIHLTLALWRVARMKTWRLPRATLWQLGTGVLIVPLGLPHFFEAGVGPREAHAIMRYRAELGLLWPDAAISQSLLLLVVWTHGCIGLHQWLKGEAWWARRIPLLTGLATLVPALALAGFVVGAREVEQLKLGVPLPYPRSELPVLQAGAATSRDLALVALALAVGFALASAALAHRRRRLAVCYQPGPKVMSAPGPTLLEISRAHRVPHLSVCGGKARCSTCRVRVLDGAEGLATPSEAEAALLKRIGADEDVRLACQIRPQEALTVTRLLNPETAAPALRDGLEAAGVVRVATVLFLDIRGFTALSEAKLAFDIVYILNTFFAEAGRAVEASGGRVDKYMGDGMMALFEHADGLGPATRNAFSAVLAIDAALARVNLRLEGEIGAPLSVAMGLHGGRLVSGRIGYGEAGRPTVIGRVVNIASRLESLAKARGVELALSLDCAKAAGLAMAGLVTEAADLRGLDSSFPVALVPCVADLASLGPETPAPA